MCVICTKQQFYNAPLRLFSFGNNTEPLYNVLLNCDVNPAKLMKEKLYNLLHKRPPKNSALFSSIVCSGWSQGGFDSPVIYSSIFVVDHSLLSGPSEDNNDDQHLIMTSFLSFSGGKS